NGAQGIEIESSYTFTYGNTQFFILDVMSATEPQTAWLKEQLAASDALWKIAVFHFPLYSNEGAYPHLEKQWGSLFDTYHVDLVLTGHVHTHMRTHPIRGGQVVDSTKDGTIYVTSISIPNRGFRHSLPEFVAEWIPGEYFCNVITVDGKRLEFRSINPDGETKDHFVIEK